MTDPNEIRALKASLRGALDAAGALRALQERVEAFDDRGEIGGDDLEELTRLVAANAVAATALRGLVNTIHARREANAAG